MLQFALARGIGEVSIKKAIAFIESNNLSWDDFIQDRNLLYHFGLKDNVITIGNLLLLGLYQILTRTSSDIMMKKVPRKLGLMNIAQN